MTTAATTANREPGDAVLSLRGVDLGYASTRRLLRRAKRPVLEDINLTLRQGQTIGILGRNGAGKSSLLRLLAGVVTPDRGEVLRHRADLRIALLTMQLGFQPQLSGRENAMMGCLLMGLSRRESEALLPEIIEFAGLEDAIDEVLNSYSSGMRARLGFSVAYFTRADVMLIDEALGVGDHEFRLKSRTAMLEAIASDRTVVLVSHDESLLLEHCESLLWLEGGRIAMSGPPADVLKYYHAHDHMTRELARNLNTTVEAVRRHPNNRDPRGHLDRLRKNLRRQRREQVPADSTGMVRFYFPGGRETLSVVCPQECGTTAWIEQAREIASGEDAAVRDLYERYEAALYQLGRATNTTQQNARLTPVNREFVQVLTGMSGFFTKNHR